MSRFILNSVSIEKQLKEYSLKQAVNITIV